MYICARRRWEHLLGALATPGLQAEAVFKQVRIGVAEASGGFLGLGNKVSAQEQAMLDDLASVLS